MDSPTNQIFIIVEDDKLEHLREKVEYSYIEKYDDTHIYIDNILYTWVDSNGVVVDQIYGQG